MTNPSATSLRAKNTPELSILVEAVVAADLAATLSTGTLTVFAPTNAAFAALLTVLGVSKESLLANKPLLTAVLTYHVVAGKDMAKDVKAGKVKAAQSQDLTVTTKMSVMVDQTKVIATDVAASNGLTHATDSVQMTKE